MTSCKVVGYLSVLVDELFLLDFELCGGVVGGANRISVAPGADD